MFRTSSTFDKLLDKATSNLNMEPHWQSIIQICDLIRQGDVQPKIVVSAIKKKISNGNPHVAEFSLHVLESCVKNCGSLIHEEVGTKAFMEYMRDTVRTSPHEKVKNKALELLQTWAFAFRNSPKYRAVQDTVNIMKAEGYKFPALKESDAMFSADTAPEWADGECCHRCRVQFGMVQRKHHCRACGQVFCAQCSAKSCTLPKFGIEKEVRVCDSCFDKVNKQPATSKTASEDLPVEYLTSSLAQQSQAPPQRKSDEELREEEELQLALALSQSEAEQKTKFRSSSSSLIGQSSQVRAKSHSPPPTLSTSPEADPELARYLNRNYWQQQVNEHNSPSAPASLPVNIKQETITLQQNGVEEEMEEFVNALRSQVEIFVNRMKSNSSRGRSIANDSSVQTLFMNITAMHSRLLRYIQQQDDSRVHYEGLQDKLTQVKDARAALDALREEHREKLRREAEFAERQRQMQMAQKLDIMRKKKQEYLQYQRQLALQRIQEQEREMQMRQEQQKQQYLLGAYANVHYMQGFDGSAGRYPPPPHQQPFPPFQPGAPMPPPGAPMPPPGSMMPMPDFGMGAVPRGVPQHQMQMAPPGPPQGPPGQQSQMMMGPGGMMQPPPQGMPPQGMVPPQNMGPQQMVGPPPNLAPGQNQPMAPPMMPQGPPQMMMGGVGQNSQPSLVAPQLSSPTVSAPPQMLPQPSPQMLPQPSPQMMMQPQAPPHQPPPQLPPQAMPPQQLPPQQMPPPAEQDRTAELISFD